MSDENGNQDGKTPEQLAAEERQQQRQDNQQQQQQQQNGKSVEDRLAALEAANKGGGDNGAGKGKLPEAKDDPEPMIDDYEDVEKWTNDLAAWETREDARQARTRQQERQNRQQQRRDEGGDDRNNNRREPEGGSAQDAHAAELARITADAQKEMLGVVGQVAGEETQGKLATMLQTGEITLTPTMLEKLDDVLATVPADGADRVAAVLAHFVDHPASAKALARSTPETQRVRMERLLENAAETARAARVQNAQTQDGTGQLRPAAGGLRNRNRTRQMEEAAEKGDFATFSKLRDEESQANRQAW